MKADDRSRAVLVVEDEEVSLVKVSEGLRQNGFEVVEARDGQSAWEMFSDITSLPAIDIVVTDVEMPHMDGLEFTTKLRQVLPEMPVIVLTSHGDKETIKAALRAGANEFLEKPVTDTDALAVLVNELIEQHPGRLNQPADAATSEAIRKIQESLLKNQQELSPIRFIADPLDDTGGDIFWHSMLEDESILFLVGDVSGRSVESSYAAASFLGMLTTYGAGARDLVPLLQTLNDHVRSGPFPQIPIAALLGRWYPKSATLDLANAGLSHVWVYQPARGESKRIELNGEPLGSFEQARVGERVVLLEKGDRVLVSSKGLLDAGTAERGAFDREIEGEWKILKSMDLADALSAIYDKARHWNNGAFTDDIMIAAFEQPE